MNAIRYPETVDEMHEALARRLADVVPDFELRLKAEIAVEINRLKRQKRAIILGHNYMEPALYHSVPDYTGDSLYLSRVAAQTQSDIIVFCGVRFMAETAKILNPDRLVLLPSAKGGCSLAESITADDVRALKALFPGVPVVSYVNTYAEVKAESDYCCTSGNGEAVVRSLRAAGHERVIFLPDAYLASNVAREVGLPISFAQRNERGEVVAPEAATGQRGVIGWCGTCEVHERFSTEDVAQARQQFSGVVVLAHPECKPEVVEAADYAGSTAGMIRFVEQLKEGRYLLLTECAMGDNIAASRPDLELIRMCSIRCPHMNEITLEQTLASLQEERYPVDVQPAIRDRARQALERMIGIG